MAKADKTPTDLRGAAMRTYRRPPTPARVLVVEPVACPAIHEVAAECVTARAQLIKTLVAEHCPHRPVPPMAGTAAIGAVVRLPATAHRGGPGARPR